MSTRNLHKFEMKELVDILLGTPAPGAELTYNEAIKKKVKNLPRRLRISTLRSLHNGGSRELCLTHKGLNVHLIHNVWSWVKHEIYSAIGKFTYPIIVSGSLTPNQELGIRQLEPVLEMWQNDFRASTSAPPGREPIKCGSKWSYQPDHCAACMLTRIGSDENALFALFAGMVGRLSIPKLVHGNHTLNDIKVSHLDRLRSKRARFVRYWIKASRSGDTLLYKAGEFGINLKKINETLKQGKISSMYGNTYDYSASISQHPASPALDPFRDPIEEMEHLHLSNHTRKDSAHDTKIGPLPRPANIDQYTPLEQLHLGFDSSISEGSNSTGRNSACSSFTGSDSAPSLYSDNSSVSDYASTIWPDDSISVTTPLNVVKKPACEHRNMKPPTSVASFTTIQSYTNGGSRDADSSVRDPLATQSEMFSKYKALLNPHPQEGSRAMYSLPVPQRESMYFGFVDKKAAKDPFEDVDEEGGEDEVVDLEEGDETGTQ